MRAANLSYLAVVVALASGLQAAAPKENQRTFATPQEAAQALIDATEHNDSAAMLKVLGPDGKDIIASGDPAEDVKHRADFARLAHQKLRIDQENPLNTTLIIGEQEWPFPVPLVEK